MAQKFFAYLTTRGEAKLAQATALGVQLKLTQMGVGDGGGTLPTPSPSQTKLVNERRRAGLNSLTVDPQNLSQIIAEQVIPENEGGWWIREIGLYDDAGEMIAVANCAETYKPLLAEGSGRTQVIRMVLIVSSTEAVTLKIDPSVILATRKYVDDAMIVVSNALAGKQPLNDTLTALSGKDVNGIMEWLSALAGDYASAAGFEAGRKEYPYIRQSPTNEIVRLATRDYVSQAVSQAISSLVASSPAALDTLKELADALGNDPSFAANMVKALAGKQPLDATLSALAGKNIAGLVAYLSVLTADYASAAGFEAGRVDTPYMRHSPSSQVIRLATRDYVSQAVSQAISSLVASSPAALDTLKELADALGNDPSFAANMVNALAGKQPLDATLSALAGRSVAGLHSYLGLGEAAKRSIGAGAGQIPDMSYFASDLRPTGIQRLPGGNVRQWGRATPGPGGVVTVNYPVAYSQPPFTILFGYRQSTAPTAMQSIILDDRIVNNIGFQATAFQLQDGQMTAGASSFFWEATGV